jgi:hypothetical protein
VTQLVEALRYKPEGCGFDSRWCHGNFSLTKFFRPHYGSGVDSAPNRNEYQEYFLGGKGGRCVVLTTLHIHVPIVLKSGNVNLLDPSGPVQACNGIALPLYYNVFVIVYAQTFRISVFVYFKICKTYNFKTAHRTSERFLFLINRVHHTPLMCRKNVRKLKIPLILFLKLSV